MNKFFKLSLSVLMCTLLAGCATIKPQPVICTVLGATLGAGLVAGPIDADSDGAIAGGALLGAGLGYLLCREKEAEPAPAPKPRPKPAPKPMPPKDTDGDGVIDSLDKCPGTPAGVAVDSSGCPKVGEVLISLRGVNFATNSAKILPESEGILGEAVRVLKDNASVHVRVEGHTDSRGSHAFNQRLSERRARSVTEYLVAHGVDADRLASIGYGEGSPVAPNDTPENMYMNRRVDLVVTSK